MLNLRRYDPGIHPILLYYMSLAGMTLEQIAEELGIAVITLKKWRQRYPELRDAMKPGKDFVDHLVEGSLLKRALGYDYDEVTRERVAIKFEVQGSVLVPVKWGMQITKRVKKHMPGDVGAQCMWAKNRMGWKDRGSMELSGANGAPLFPTVVTVTLVQAPKPDDSKHEAPA
jgi:transcriptional regulator with XRE-family HTH domain